MFYLVRFVHYADGMDLDTFIVLDEEDYESFRKHGGEQKLFTRYYQKTVDDKQYTFMTSCKFSAATEFCEYINDGLYDVLIDGRLQEDVDTWLSELRVKIWLLCYTKQCKYCALNASLPYHLKPKLEMVSVAIAPHEKDLFFEFYSDNKIPVPEICPKHEDIFYWSFDDSVDIRDDLDKVHVEENIITSYLRTMCSLTPLTEEMIRSMK